MPKKPDPLKQQLLRDFETFVAQLLDASPVMKVADLDERVRQEFLERIAAAKLDVPLKSGRAEWANLVDWVKAYMTRRGWLRYFTLNGNRFVAYLPACGRVDETSLVKFSAAARLTTCLIDILEGT